MSKIKEFKAIAVKNWTKSEYLFLIAVFDSNSNKVEYVTPDQANTLSKELLTAINHGDDNRALEISEFSILFQNWRHLNDL